MSCQSHILEPPRETRRPPLGGGAAGPQQHLLSTSPLKKATFPQFKVFFYQEPLLPLLELMAITFPLFNNQTTALFQLHKSNIWQCIEQE